MAHMPIMSLEVQYKSPPYPSHLPVRLSQPSSSPSSIVMALDPVWGWHSEVESSIEPIAPNLVVIGYPLAGHASKR